MGQQAGNRHLECSCPAQYSQSSLAQLGRQQVRVLDARSCSSPCSSLTSGGTPSPGHTQMKPSFSTHGSADTDTLRHSTVLGILVQLPSPSNCQPW
jgi:hypothetical protein